jgi:hypothetical protein
MWRLYVGGILTGFAMGVFVGWLAVWSLLPESTRTQFAPWMPLLLLPFVLAGETLRVRSKKHA